MKGNYVLSLKENQPTLYEYAKTYFKDALDIHSGIRK